MEDTVARVERDHEKRVKEGKASGKELDYFDEKTKKRFYPHIVETSVGISRIFLALLVDAYREEKARFVFQTESSLRLEALQ